MSVTRCCVECGAPIVGRDPRANYCEEACRSRRHNRRCRERTWKSPEWRERNREKTSAWNKAKRERLKERAKTDPVLAEKMREKKRAGCRRYHERHRDKRRAYMSAHKKASWAATSTERADKSKGRKEAQAAAFTTKWALQPLGLVPDSWIAQAMGVTATSVLMARRKLRIPAPSCVAWSRCCACCERISYNPSNGHGQVYCCTCRTARLSYKVSSRIRRIVIERDSSTCVYCGVTVRGQSAHIDHIIPRSSGGGDTLLNMVLACSLCNVSKSDNALELSWRTEVTARAHAASLKYI